MKHKLTTFYPLSQSEIKELARTAAETSDFRTAETVQKEGNEENMGAMKVIIVLLLIVILVLGGAVAYLILTRNSNTAAVPPSSGATESVQTAPAEQSEAESIGVSDEAESSSVQDESSSEDQSSAESSSSDASSAESSSSDSGQESSAEDSSEAAEDSSEDDTSSADAEDDSSDDDFTPVSPDVHISEDVLATAFNANHTDVFCSSDPLQFFMLNGYKFYQGARFNSPEKNCEVSFNVTGHSQLSFLVAHLDNTDWTEGTLYVYVDNDLAEEIFISGHMQLTRHTINIKGASKVRFVVNKNNYYSGFGIGDIMIDGSTPKLPNVTPDYQNETELIAAGFNAIHVDKYDGSDQTKKFSMNGEEFRQGIVFASPEKLSEISLNTEKLDKLTFTIGHIDNTDKGAGTIQIFADDELVETIDVNGEMLTERNHTIDVSDISVVQFLVQKPYYTAYAIADIKMTKK